MNSIVDSAAADVTLRIVAGPTGAGKSALALELAERHGALIVSADSRQIYAGFNVGTAAPTVRDRERVPHRGIGHVEATERWSAAQWARDAWSWIAQASERGQPVIVVGGTGLWLRALVQPLADEPPMDPDQRARLREALGAFDTPTLRRWVQTLDPSRAALGRVQLLRAAEIAILSGTRASEWHAAGAAKPRARARWLIVDPLEALHARLAGRFDEMLAHGWYDEVAALARVLPPDALAWNACGYREIRDWVEGRITEAAAREAIVISTRQYAKRQRTWFRNQLKDEPDVLRLDPRSTDALERADRWLFDGGSS